MIKYNECIYACLKRYDVQLLGQYACEAHTHAQLVQLAIRAYDSYLSFFDLLGFHEIKEAELVRESIFNILKSRVYSISMGEAVILAADFYDKLYLEG